MKCLSNLLLVLVIFNLALDCRSAPSMRRSRSVTLPSEETNPSVTFPSAENESKIEEDAMKTDFTTPESTNSRKNKALNLFGYFPSYLASGLDYGEDDDDDVTFGVNDDSFDDEDLSRTIPTRRRQQNKKKNGNGNGYANDNINSLQYDNSPIFYIRLPPTPYMFVPGLGYVSQPPSLGPPMAPPIPQVADPFINLPLDFVSNGKPTGVYQWSGASGYPQMPQVPQMPPVDAFGYGAPHPMGPPAPRPSYNIPSYSKPKPKPTPSNSKVTNLKGPYVFNGKPGDQVYVLQDTYNSIYSDALQNFYP